MVRSSSVLGLSLLASFGWPAEIQRTVDPCVSPDGGTVAFAWQGDIWIVPTSGGQATRLTVHPADDSMPKWSPDGKRIFFASSRAGSVDVYSMTVGGGDLRRVTFESSTEYPQSFSPDGQYLYGYTNAFGRGDLFRVKATGGDLVRLTGHPLEYEYYPAVSPDGKWVAYNTSGSPGNWRKPGHAGSNTGRIWLAENSVPLSKHRMLLSGDHEDIFPVYSGPEQLVFVSNRSGAPNVWSVKTSGSGLTQLTRFADGTVRSLSSGSGVVVFQKDSRIWRLSSGHDAEEVAITAPSDSPRDPIVELNLATGASGFSVSPNGKRTAIALRGDLFLIPERGGTTRRLTTSARLDEQPVWLDDKSILYVAAADASKRTLRTVDLEGNTKLFKEDSKDLNTPTVSPDRKWVAFHRGDREVCVMPASGGDSKVLASGDFGESIGGNRMFSWSPDSQWIVYRASLERGIQVAMAKVDGSQTVEVARIGKDCSTPIFASDGKAIVFSATEGVNYSEVRDGKSPVYVVDLVPQPVTYSEDDLDKIDQAKDEPQKAVQVRVVERGLNKRVRILGSTSAGSVYPGADGKSVYTNVEGQFSSVNLKTGLTAPVAGVTGAVSSVDATSSKQKVYFLQAGKLSALAAATGTVAPIAFAAQYKVDQAAEEAALFDEVWWAMSRMYYNPAMNGKDWPGIREKFSKIVPMCQSRDDFYALMGEMMELLDSSHLGATAPAGTRSAAVDDTAWLGVQWDAGALDARDSYVVQKVYEGSPASLPDSELQVGDRVTLVDGVKPGASQPMAALLNRKAGRKVTLTVSRGSKEMVVTIQPARAASRTAAFYDDWVDGNKAMVDRLSGGKLGYIHIESMDVPSLDVFYKEIQTELNGKSGVLLDVRFNGGGFTSHIILNTMLKVPWLLRTTRDKPGVSVSENNYRGNALELPAGCLTNQYSFSNAEIFSEGFRALKLGPVVGEPTAGGVIGTGAYGMWDGGLIRMPGSGAYAINGDNLEQNGRKPDIDVRWDPNMAMQGRDPQLEVAVRELLKRIGKKA